MGVVTFLFRAKEALWSVHLLGLCIMFGATHPCYDWVLGGYRLGVWGVSGTVKEKVLGFLACVQTITQL